MLYNCKNLYYPKLVFVAQRIGKQINKQTVTNYCHSLVAEHESRWI